MHTWICPRLGGQKVSWSVHTKKTSRPRTGLETPLSTLGLALQRPTSVAVCDDVGACPAELLPIWRCGQRNRLIPRPDLVLLHLQLHLQQQPL